MPYISDDELLDFQVQIDNAKEEKRATNYTHTKALREEQENSRKFKIATIILGIIALLGVAGTIYFMKFNTPDNLIAKSESKAKSDILKNKIAELEETIKNLSMDQEINAANSNTGEQQEKASLQGELVYAVQIGAFEEKDLSLYSDKFVNFKQIKAGSFNKYALGNFASLAEAKKFRRELVGLGFRGAFIASYQNGKRIKIEEAW
ncbi:SPOR domain-containing protein [Aquimarina sp. MMG015]|uniref:SPOR domain-containing protein n=1 Tax=Aquimarina TaxID=290174 RepID=UPI0004138DD5|nr:MULTISPECIES: SPOR domain-containing protein [Aquimarina]AXT56582.1 SPOR domain-containing protein [Aquimarina sp. AD1]MBQ4802589.1 SPOR domain-containing protein [Aquimarina sp. MMG015]RKN33814.1 SPOR domain-containing protein [Aquimarina sp. AD1]